jgi:hypothetical protein
VTSSSGCLARKSRTALPCLSQQLLKPQQQHQQEQSMHQHEQSTTAWQPVPSHPKACRDLWMHEKLVQLAAYCNPLKL